MAWFRTRKDAVVNHYLRHAGILGLQPDDAIVAYRRRGAPCSTTGGDAVRGSYEHVFLHRYLPRDAYRFVAPALPAVLGA